jgi:3-hydroxyisobutyrate dehydrogenase-like beta-hydroxyacid dehydrogenase
MTAQFTIGFIGLGVMGEPMCRNLATKSGQSVLAYDLSPAALARLRPHDVVAAESVRALAVAADIVFLALPSGAQVETVCAGEDSILAAGRAGQVVVDLGTSPVKLTRELAARFAARGIDYADAPVARTREAAERGTLSIMVGASDAVFARIRPLLACVASDITHCGAVGAGQVVKILNNMVLFETVVALSEALAVARRAGLDGGVLFETLTKGSADSFALRNHGMKAVLPGVFPDRAFSAEYALKDLTYALDLAAQSSLRLKGAELAGALLREAIAAGDGDAYWPVLSRVVERG